MNNSIKTLTAAALAVVFLSDAALAQDATDWQGTYAGGQISLNNPGITGIALPLNDGLSGGLFAGYNHAISPEWVLGGELAYDHKSSTDVVPGNNLELENTITARARAGYAVGNALIYGAVGYTSVGDYGFSAFGTRGSADGLSYGVGVETLLTDNLTARVDYTRMDLDLSGGALPGLGLKNNVISMGLAYKF